MTNVVVDLDEFEGLRRSSPWPRPCRVYGADAWIIAWCWQGHR